MIRFTCRHLAAKPRFPNDFRAAPKAPAIKSGATRVSQRREGGFVLTIELLLITTILIIGSFVGVVAIRDALIKQAANQQSRGIVVYDNDGVPLGPFMGFDEHEAPLVPYIDRTVEPLSPDPDHRNYRALIGVRDDRFTSREPVYYSEDNCTGVPCIKVPSDETTDSVAIDGDASTGAVGYLYALQRGPTYAVGSSPDGIQGFLYRQAPEVCPVEPESIRSRYLSQKVVRDSPCEAYTAVMDSPPDTECLVDVEGAAPCQCDAGFVDQGDVIGLFAPEIDAILTPTVATVGALVPGLPDVTVGKICCPAGTVLEEQADLPQAIVFILLTEVLAPLPLPGVVRTLVEGVLQPLSGSLNCRAEFNLQSAVSVPDPDDGQANALENFAAPFQVNLPGDRADDSWMSTPPDGKEGFTP